MANVVQVEFEEKMQRTKIMYNKWRKCLKVQQQTLLVKFDVLLTVHRSIILTIDQINA